MSGWLLQSAIRICQENAGLRQCHSIVSSSGFMFFLVKTGAFEDSRGQFFEQ
jgi:hypothetical protein